MLTALSLAVTDHQKWGSFSTIQVLPNMEASNIYQYVRIILLTSFQPYNPDDIARFKGDAEVAFKAFSRLRGRSRDSNELHQYFLQLIKEQVEDEVSGGGDNDETASAAADRAAKKRGRSSDAAEGAAGLDDPAKKKFGKARKDASEEGDDNVVEMTTAQRVSCYCIMQKVLMHTRCSRPLTRIGSFRFGLVLVLVQWPCAECPKECGEGADEA
jgi:hypothetical protein